MCVYFADKKTEVWRRGLIQVQIEVQRLPQVRTGPLTHFSPRPVASLGEEENRSIFTSGPCNCFRWGKCCISRLKKASTFGTSVEHGSQF